MNQVVVPPRRNPWPVRIAVGCGGVLLVVLLLVVGAVVWVTVPHQTEAGRCRQTLGVECTNVPAAKIAQAMEMTFPPGTVIRDSQYRSFLDDQLTATVEIPAAGVPAWQGSLSAWRDALECRRGVTTCGYKCPPDAVCFERPEQSPHRSFERRDRPDGSVELRVTYFTT